MNSSDKPSINIFTNANSTDAIEVAVYARNSDKAQIHSQDVQADVFALACNELLPQLLGKPGRINTIYTDNGKSASQRKSKRSEFTRLCKDIESGSVRVLMVVNTSRISRFHPLDAMEFYRLIREHRVTLVVIDDRKIYDPDAFGDLITLLVKSNENHEYARTIAKNTLRGRLHSIKRGNACLRTVPYGMQKLVIDDVGGEHRFPRTTNFNKPKTWTSHVIPGDEQEQQVVRRIFTMFDTTDISYAGIATKLNNDNISGPTGNGWTDHAIAHVLQNRHYAGMVFVGQECEGEHYRIGDTGDVVERKLHTTSKPIVTKTKHQPLIDPELFDRVQVKITIKKDNDRRPHTNTNREGFALTGCLVCGNCGGSMFAVNNCKNGSIRYQCRNASRNTSKGCSYWSASESEMLPYLLSAIDTSVIKQLADAPTIPTDAEQQRIDREIADIDSKLIGIKAKIKHASVDATLALADTITSLTDRRTQLQQQRRSVSHTDRVQAAFDRWEALVQPYLIPIVTNTAPPLAHQLGIESEYNRLFNTIHAKPSAVRAMLQSLDTRVECWFTEQPAGKRSQGRKRAWQLDRARLSATISGKSVTTVEGRAGELGRSAAEGGWGFVGHRSPEPRLVQPTWFSDRPSR